MASLRQTLAPVSIRQSLGKSLPDLPLGKDDPRAEVSEGAHTTQNMPPPKMAFPRRDNIRWYKLGADSFDNESQKPESFVKQVKAVQEVVRKTTGTPQGKEKEVLDFARAFHENEYFIPEIEDNIAHENEADVVRSANLYLIHPVMQAMAAFPRYHRTVVTKSEDIKGSTRTDIAFFIPREGKPPRPFAIAEYKKRQTFEPDAFNHKDIIWKCASQAWGTDDAPDILSQIIKSKPCGAKGQNEVAQAARDFGEIIENYKIQKRVDLMDGMKSVFEGSALNLIKQAASYSVTDRIRYVVLFNWECMVLCYFPWLDITKPEQDLKNDFGVNRPTRRTTANEVPAYPVEVDVYENDDPNLRLALLSFMQHAWEETKSLADEEFR